MKHRNERTKAQQIESFSKEEGKWQQRRKMRGQEKPATCVRVKHQYWASNFLNKIDLHSKKIEMISPGGTS